MGILHESAAQQHRLTPHQEWKHRLRSAIHPLVFAAVYSMTPGLSRLLQLSSAYRADLLIAAPKVLQGIFAALGDHYTWKLAERVYGNGSNEAWAVVRSILDRPSIEVRSSCRGADA